MSDAGTRSSTWASRLAWILPLAGISAWVTIEFAGPVSSLRDGEAQRAAELLAQFDRQLPDIARSLTAPWPLPRWPLRGASPHADAGDQTLPLYPELWAVGLARAAAGQAREARLLFDVDPPGPGAPEPFLAFLQVLTEDGQAERARQLIAATTPRARDQIHADMPLGRHLDLAEARAAIALDEHEVAHRLLYQTLDGSRRTPPASVATLAQAWRAILAPEEFSLVAALSCWSAGAALVTALDGNLSVLSPRGAVFGANALALPREDNTVAVLDRSLRGELVSRITKRWSAADESLAIRALDLESEASRTRGLASLAVPAIDSTLVIVPTRALASTRLAWLARATGALITLIGLLALRASWRNLKRAVEMSEARSRFVDLVSHELRTPLAAISLKSELLAQERLPREKERRYHKSLVQDVRRISDLVHRILDFSRSARSEFAVAREPVAVRALIARANVAHCRALKARGQRIQSDVPRGLPPIHGDPTLLGRALENLLDNARKYALPNEPLRWVVRPRGKLLELALIDRGPGMERSEYQRVFEAFHRGDGTGSPGTGLGLAFVARVASAHGGRAAASPTPSGGSRWILHLPLTSPDLASS